MKEHYLKTLPEFSDGRTAIYSGFIGNELFPAKLIWEVGRTYSVQPGYGQKAVARFLLTGLAKENVQDITEEGARAEGIAPNWSGDLAGWNPDVHGFLPPNYDPEDYRVYTARECYGLLWDTIHSKRNKFAMNPDVAVLTFSLEASA